MVIKEDWIQAQEGLYAELHTFVVRGTVYTRYNLYSADGYCFYNIHSEEEVPPYSTIAFTPFASIDEINQNFKSILISQQKTILEENDGINKN